MTASVSPLIFPSRQPLHTVFDRRELSQILDIYGRMVAAGHWRDYALSHERDHAVFAAFRRSSERPDMQLWKRPALRAKQGMYALVGDAGQVLKRGGDLGPVLAPIARKLLKSVE